jgi:hypothetical protein
VINHAAATSPIAVHRLRGGVSMFEGSDRNIGVLSGPEGKLMVDCGIAVSQPRGSIAASEGELETRYDSAE